jgi:hypothetical protein
MVLNFAETPASGPGDCAKQWAAEEQHSQQKRPHSAGLVTRDQDGGSEAENRNRKDGQAELGCSVGGSRPEVAPESSLVLYPYLGIRGCAGALQRPAAIRRARAESPCRYPNVRFESYYCFDLILEISRE